jgi:hypothetical protein
MISLTNKNSEHYTALTDITYTSKQLVIVAKLQLSRINSAVQFSVIVQFTFIEVVILILCDKLQHGGHRMIHMLLDLIRSDIIV